MSKQQTFLRSGQTWQKINRDGSIQNRMVLAIVNCYPYAGVRIIYAEWGPKKLWTEVLGSPLNFRRWVELVPAATICTQGPRQRRERREYLIENEGALIDA